MNQYIAGAIAGLVGTFAMTRAMEFLHGRLPARDRYPLPPSELTYALAPEALRKGLGHRRATMAAHYGYGAACGALLPLVTRRPDAVTGTAFGLGVWGISYLGLAPMLGVLRSADTHPHSRNALMIAVHVVWGSVTGAACGWLMKPGKRA